MESNKNNMNNHYSLQKKKKIKSFFVVVQMPTLFDLEKRMKINHVIEIQISQISQQNDRRR